MKIKNYRSPQRQGYYVLNPNHEIVQDTIKWIHENQKAWQTIQDLALNKAAMSEQKMSATLLVNVMRWELDRVSIANACIPVIARLLEYAHPYQLAGKFTLAQSDTEMITTQKWERDSIKARLLDMIDTPLPLEYDNGQLRLVV